MKKRVAIFTIAFISVATIVILTVVLIAVFSNEGVFQPKDVFAPEAQVELTEEQYRAQVETALNALKVTRNPRYQLACTIVREGETEPVSKLTLDASATTYRADNNGDIRYYSDENSGVYLYAPNPNGIYSADGQTYLRSTDPIDDSAFTSGLYLNALFIQLLGGLKEAHGSLTFTDGMYRVSEEGLADMTGMLNKIPGLTLPGTVEGFEVEFNRSRFYCYRFTWALSEESDGLAPGTYTVSYSFTALNNRISLPAEPGPGCSTTDCSNFW